MIPFRHELAEQSPAAGAERRPDRELAMSRLGAREQEVRHVRAGNQQHEPDGDLQYPQCPPDVAHDIALAATRTGAGD